MTLTTQLISRWAPANADGPPQGGVMERAFFHRPVMVNEVVRLLGIGPGSTCIDATLGEGGHAAALLQGATPGGRLLGLDRDPHGLEIARVRLAEWQGAFTVAHSSYTHLDRVAASYGLFPCDAILMDLGLSSLQLEGSGRGFSFQRDEPLDMRFDPDSELTAADIINHYSLDDLAHIISRYGQEPRARAIARSVVQHRPISSTTQLVDLVKEVAGRRPTRIHPATKTFQALRIEVNEELSVLESAIPTAISALKPEGRLAVISYHSLEDRIVKQTFAREATDCICPPRTPQCICGHLASVRLIPRRSMTPSSEEVADNPRSRSARLRIVQRLPREPR